MKFGGDSARQKNEITAATPGWKDLGGDMKIG